MLKQGVKISTITKMREFFHTRKSLTVKCWARNRCNTYFSLEPSGLAAVSWLTPINAPMNNPTALIVVTISPQ